MENVLKSFIAGPMFGKFLVVSECRHGHGGGAASVVDLVDVFEHIQLEEDPGFPFRHVAAASCSALYDFLVTLEVWPNGEVYISGDGINHPRYRVTALYLVDIVESLDDSDDLTTLDGIPVWWCVEPFVHRYDGQRDGDEVVMRLKTKHGWQSRHAFGSAVDLAAKAVAEFEKPKYFGTSRQVVVNDRVVRNW